jgi:hypothetical protein
MPSHPAMDVSTWLASIPARRSRRAFDTHALSHEDLDATATLCSRFTPFEDARVLLLPEAPETVFTGLIGSYGKVTGSPSALVFIADSASPHAEEHLGYTGEGIVLAANARGMQTCWIAGSFSRSAVTRIVTLRESQVVRAVSPLGHALLEPPRAERVMFGANKPKSRRSLDQIAPGQEDWPMWAQAGVRAAQVAPSAMNRQPWRFRMEGEDVVVSTSGMRTPVVSTRLDCGIAMLHFELGARGEGRDGAWEALEGHDIARWARR